MTSRQTNASRGKVVNMLRPKHLRTRAMLTTTLAVGKLFSTFPFVLSPKVTNPAVAMVKHATIETAVE
ncbi:MAG: hypothetical protein LQ348_005674 [Seirophora lacunosa]|nr:MAG: hypothetical protein LQ348_005674 [Seirophora lacunosa]